MTFTRSDYWLLGLVLCAGSWACVDRGPGEPEGVRAAALSQDVATTDDTFINSRAADNNNGASFSIFSGVDGMGGVIRGLIRFAMPAMSQGRVTVTGVKLTMTLEAVGNGSTGVGGVHRLQAVTEAWVQGNGVGNASQVFVVGQTCGAGISGATWNQPDCMTAPGTGAAWTTAGGTVATAVSGQADTTGLDANAAVVWDSTASGNAGMVGDVQGWIDNPGSNHGWRISASDETTTASAQRFFSTENGGATTPALSITYGCKAGYAPGPDIDGGVACVAGDGGATDAAGDEPPGARDGAADGGADGAAAIGGTPADSGGTPIDNEPHITGSSGGGCGCRAVASEPSGPVALLILAAAICGARRRRRRNG